MTVLDGTNQSATGLAQDARYWIPLTEMPTGKKVALALIIHPGQVMPTRKSMQDQLECKLDRLCRAERQEDAMNIVENMLPEGYLVREDCPPLGDLASWMMMMDSIQGLLNRVDWDVENQPGQEPELSQEELKECLDEQTLSEFLEQV
jgi:hypothetical protein